MKLLLKLKIWRIEKSLRDLVRDKGFKPKIWSFGVYYIDPKHLVFVVGVETDNDKRKLKEDNNFINSMRELLNIYNWPNQARHDVVFDIESQETVERENNGNWWYHYK